MTPCRVEFRHANSGLETVRVLEVYVHIIRVLLAKISLSCLFVLGTNLRVFFF